jgi:hypothetical protein
VQQAKRMQLLQPLCIISIAFAARDALDMPGVDQVGSDAMLLEQLVERHPLDPAGLQGDGIDAAGE